ncbi:hypothetical protein ACFY9N_17005 [Microbacterium sp. NPDC008134]|uniref:hypothetical protein n=1 Tax=Microbacterium sp. NPDC008134 TaxID=3364183 RepID=UPI0036F15C83
MTQPPVLLRSLLLAIAAFTLLGAVVGAIGLTVGGGMGLPQEWLDGTIFDSYLWPAVALAVIVGGTQTLALVLQLRGYALAWGLQAAAGLTLMTWIVVQVAILMQWSPLHGIFFATGLLQTTVAVLALGAWPQPFLRRTRTR